MKCFITDFNKSRSPKQEDMTHLKTFDEVHRNSVTWLPSEVPNGNICIQFCESGKSGRGARLSYIFRSQEKLGGLLVSLS